MTNLDEAFRMLDTFASCGATSFFVTKTELEWPQHKKVKWGKSYSLGALREKLPGIVRTAAIRHPAALPHGQEMMAGENVIIRPTGPGVAFVQLDDLNNPEQLERIRPASLIIHATSPGNHQAWVAVSGVPEGKEQFKEFTRRVRRAVGGNDKAASHPSRTGYRQGSAGSDGTCRGARTRECHRCCVTQSCRWPRNPRSRFQSLARLCPLTRRRPPRPGR